MSAGGSGGGGGGSGGGGSDFANLNVWLGTKGPTEAWSSRQLYDTKIAPTDERRQLAKWFAYSKDDEGVMEFIPGTRAVHIYGDVDLARDDPEELAPFTTEYVRERLLKAFPECNGAKKVYIAKKEDRLYDGKMKRSFHFYIGDLAAPSNAAVGYIVAERGLGDLCDMSVYINGDRLFCCIRQSFKDDRKVFLPVVGAGETEPDFVNFFVTRLTGSEKMLVPEQPMTPKARSGRGATGARGSEAGGVASDEDPETVRKLLSLINADCAYNTWFQVLCAVRDVVADQELAEEIADEWSMTAPERYDGDAFFTTWNSISREGKFTIGTLIMQARKDQPQQFAVLFPNGVGRARDAGGAGAYGTVRGGGVSDDERENRAVATLNTLYQSAKVASPSSCIADVATEILGYECHVFAGPDRKNWYVCINGIWHNDNAGMYLRERIKRRVRAEILEERGRNEAIAAALPDAEKQAAYRKERVASLTAIAQMLVSSRPLDDAVYEMRIPYYRARFENLLDTKRGILPFTDGVYDFGERVFRDYRADDYVTKTVGYAYADMMRSDVNLIAGLLTRIFADNPEKFAMMRVIIANACDCDNKRESLDIWIGDKGANGKTTVLDIIKAAFGDLSITLSGDALTKDADLNPQIARFQGARFAVMSEPNSKLEFNGDLVKKLTGNDLISARMLFKSPREFRASANVVVVCNALPTLSHVDNGLRRRIKVMEFNQCFKAVPDPARPNEQLADDDLKQRIDADPLAFGMALMRWAMELRASDDWNVARQVVPACCRVATEEYLNEADPYSITMAEYVVTRERNDYVLVGDMYVTYKVAGGNETLLAFGRQVGKRFEGTGAEKARREGKTAWLNVRRIAPEDN